MECPDCKSIISDDLLFCPNCKSILAKENNEFGKLIKGYAEKISLFGEMIVILRYENGFTWYRTRKDQTIKDKYSSLYNELRGIYYLITKTTVNNIETTTIYDFRVSFNNKSKSIVQKGNYWENSRIIKACEEIIEDNNNKLFAFMFS